MPKVRRANVILTIADDNDIINKYKAKGYSVIDEHGSVIESSTANDIENLQYLVNQLQEENAKLKAELSKRSEKKRTKKSEKSEVQVEE